jgi:starvation-inducible DNA-binding protein
MARNSSSAAMLPPTGFGQEVVNAISAKLNQLLADCFALYIKTKNFHWHMTGPHFRDHHRLLDEQASEVLAMTDPIAERVRKLGAATLHSIGEIARQQRIRDNEAHLLSPDAMLLELLSDNDALENSLRKTHALCDRHEDIATASLIENWVEETEGRVWFLREITVGDVRSN